MKVGQNVTIYAGAFPTAGPAGNVFGFKDQAASPSQTAGYLNGQSDPIAQKQAMAKKQAYKVVSDTWASERKIDDGLKERSDHIDQLRSERAASRRQMKAIEDEKEALREGYGVAKDSQEQKDLEILEQYHRYKDHRSYDLSEEDLARAMELTAQGYGEGYTDYQKRALRLDAFKYPEEDKVDGAEKGIKEECAIIRATGLERLKYHPMLDAAQEAEQILSEASDEIIGMLIDEAKDHIDEKREEEQEKAEERKEEEQEEAEKLEAAKERREELEALADPEKAEREHRSTAGSGLSGDPITEQMVKMDQVQDSVKQEIDDIVMKMKLVAEDVKGIKVDEQV